MKDHENSSSGPGDPTISIHGDITERTFLSETPEIKTRFGRYQLTARIGSGGMGEVYKAYDPTLERWVALKILYPGDPHRVDRFLQEARAQARVKHPNICPVFDIGEIDGRPYIAMQYIDGFTLNEMADRLNREAMLRIIHTVAMALHAAHMQGLVHRDIKPSNIMVERAEDGTWRPYLLDFGLARDITTLSDTRTGSILGTPQFMAPEQARGLTRTIDRRTDVWGLGATLYALLCGTPPFEGVTSFETLQKVVHEEATPLRKRRSDIPRDLETIVMTCLEKDPQRRYPSARELANDIERFLRGDPIHAQPIGWFRRFRLKIRKYPIASSAIAFAFVTLMLSGGWVSYTRWHSLRQARLAQTFGQQIERIESRWRITTMLPRHPVKRELQQIREQMEEIREQMNRLGSVAQGPGYYALGRSYRVLGELDKAWKHLNRAWNLGYRNPDVALVLGLTGAEIYRKHFITINRIRDPFERRRKMKELIRKWKIPVLNYLHRGQTTTWESPEYVLALLSFVDGRYPQALRLAREAVQKTPWLYEAHLLQAETLLTQAMMAGERGQPERARTLFRQALNRVKVASRLAPSSPQIYTTGCRIYERFLSFEAYTGIAVTTLYRHGLETCKLGFTVQPNSSTLNYLIAGLHWRMAEYALYHDMNAEPYLNAALHRINEALENEPHNPEILNKMGMINLVRADNALAHGLDPTPHLNQASEAFSRSLKLQKDNPAAIFGMGTMWLTRAEFAMNRGQDPKPLLERAIQAYRKTLHLEPNHLGALNNLGISFEYAAREAIERGQDPEKDLENAIQMYKKILDLNPNDALSLTNLGNVYANLARFRLEHGRDPVQPLESAIEYHSRAARASPDDPVPPNNLAFVWKTWAYYLLITGDNPRPMLIRSRQASQRALQINATFVDSLINHAEADIIEMEYHSRRGYFARFYYKRALEYLDKAKNINASVADIYDLVGRAHTLAIQVPRNPDTRQYTQAVRAFRRAIRIDSNNPDYHTHLARLEYEMGRLKCSSKNPCPYLQRARRAVDSALKLNARSAEALALRTRILILLAQRATGHQREQLFQNAYESLQLALQINPNLTRQTRELRELLKSFRPALAPDSLRKGSTTTSQRQSS